MLPEHISNIYMVEYIAQYSTFNRMSQLAYSIELNIYIITYIFVIFLNTDFVHYFFYTNFFLSYIQNLFI